MADLDITQDATFTNETAPQTSDRMLIMRTGIKDITLDVLFKIIASLTAKTTLANNDKIPLSDSAASDAAKHITLENLRKSLFASPAQGDVVYYNGTDWVRLPAGTSGQVLQTQGAGANPQWSSSSGTGKGFGQILVATVPLTVGAPIASLDGASSPAEGFAVYSFVDGSLTYRDFLVRLLNYNGGGLTVNFEVMRTTSGAGLRYVFDAAIRRLNAGTEELAASHTYDYNSTTITIPAGPPAATIPMSGTITFTDGADMDNLANNELFWLRIRRNGTHANDDATDTARVLPAITIRET